MEQMLFLVPVVGLLGLLFAVILRQQVVKEDPGTDKMREMLTQSQRAPMHFWLLSTAYWSFL